MRSRARSSAHPLGFACMLLIVVMVLIPVYLFLQFGLPHLIPKSSEQYACDGGSKSACDFGCNGITAESTRVACKSRCTQECR